MTMRPHEFGRRCPSCDYDLHGLPDVCPCPECGTQIGPGLKSVAVWPGSERPSVLGLAIVISGCLFFALGTMLGVVTGRAGCFAVFIAVLASILAFAALDEFMKLRQRAAGRTVATLHFSPRGVGLWEDHRLNGHPWNDVARIRYARTLGKEWILRVEGRRKWTGRRRRLITASIEATRRDAARIRNSMRRMHDAAT